MRGEYYAGTGAGPRIVKKNARPRWLGPLSSRPCDQEVRVAAIAQPVEARGLTKRFGEFTAVDGIDFTVGPGECVGFLGPNGAGKTTTVRMLCCASPVTAGEARVFGLDVSVEARAIKARLGICPQEDNLDPDFTVRQNLLVYARYFALPRAEAAARADALLALMQLTEKSRAKIPELSGGMKRRLVLARALINHPELLVLDEPTTGLDPQARQLIWERVRKLRAAGTAVLLTTHYMEEASRLCDRVILMDGGKILLEGAPATLIAETIGREVVELLEPDEALTAFVAERGWPSESSDDRFFVYDRQGAVVAQAIAEAFPRAERLIRHATLEDVFLHRTGRTLRD